MDDKTKTEFLRGLRLVRDADNNVSLYGPDGDHVIDVRGNLGLDLGAYQIGAWVTTACHEYAARRRDQTHHADCWRLPGHEGCARGLLKRWWPVIEAARDWHETRHAILGNRSVDSDEALAWAPLILARTRAALKEGSADD